MFDLHLRFQVDSVEQPIKRNSVGSGHVSHCRTSSFDSHVDDSFVVFKNVQLRLALKRIWVCGDVIHMRQLINISVSLLFGFGFVISRSWSPIHYRQHRTRFLSLMIILMTASVSSKIRRPLRRHDGKNPKIDFWSCSSQQRRNSGNAPTRHRRGRRQWRQPLTTQLRFSLRRTCVCDNVIHIWQFINISVTFLFTLGVGISQAVSRCPLGWWCRIIRGMYHFDHHIP